jgi:transposase-like protein
LFLMQLAQEAIMIDADFQRLIGALAALLPAQLVGLDVAVRQQMARVKAQIAATPVAFTEPVAAALACPPQPVAADVGPTFGAIEARFAQAPRCPGCAATAIKKWGSANGLKRYRCKRCRITFNALTGTPLAQLHKRELWGGHAQALVEGVSLRKVAERLDVDLTTAFRWRHRFLQAPKDVKAQHLQGTVEADETYVLYSEKGAHGLQRPARKRGGKAAKRGLSDEQVPVLIARDRHNATTDQILEDRSTRSIAAVLGPVVAKTAVLVSDGAQAYAAFARKAGVAHVGLNLSAGERTCGVYHIQNVNNYGSRLKTWMRRFNGVATKYLDSYLGWHRTNDREGNTLCASRMLAAAWG